MRAAATTARGVGRVVHALRWRVRRLRRRWQPPPSTSTRELAAWERCSPVATADDLGRIVDRPAGVLQRWRTRPPLAATYLHPLDPHPTSGMRARYDDLRHGRFTPHTSVPVRDEALPPAWDTPADAGRTEAMYRHSLRWLEPVIKVAQADDDAQAWQLACAVVESWIRDNATPPRRSTQAWHDHGVSIRVRILCWMFELYRRRDDADPALLRLIVASVHQHAVYLADDATYAPRSNHALEANGSLLAVCVTLPELRDTAMWSAHALRRLDDYTAHAFTDDGFSKEQSPRYHFFILRRLAALVSFLTAVGLAVPEGVRTRLDQATAVWPWLLRDDGSMPRVGDTNEPDLGQWRSALADTITMAPPPAAPSTQPNPRTDRAGMLVSFDAGYAIMRGAPPRDDTATDTEHADDTHVLFKCNYFDFPHFHHDGLSFVFYADGREWLIDPGPHSYEYARWERRYLVSSSAHNVVEVDEPFALHPVELVAVQRDDDGDRVSARHHLPGAVHDRTVTHRPGMGVDVVDVVTVTDGATHRIRQLFHAAADLTVAADGDTVRLTTTDGRRCVVTHHGPGAWEIVRGRREPEVLGWWSPRSLEVAPTTTCVFSTTVSDRVRLETTITLSDGASE